MRFSIALLIALSLVGCAASGSGAAPADEMTMAKQVDASATASHIAGNLQKYVGAIVRFKCRVGAVTDPRYADALCADGAQVDIGSPHIALVGDVKNLDAGQNVDVLGTVMQPLQTKNALGMPESLPAVRVAYFVTSESPSEVQSRIDAHDRCIDQYADRMSHMPRGVTFDQFLDDMISGLQACDHDNGFATLPVARINAMVNSAPANSSHETDRNFDIPYAPPTSAPAYQRAAFQKQCISYLGQRLPGFIKSNGYDQSSAVGLVFAEIEDCDDISGLKIVPSKDIHVWLKRAGLS